MSDDEAAISAKVRASGLIGKVIAERYRIDEVLAMGGMGAVFSGEHVHMRKRVAIKVLHPATLGFPELVTRFERESIVGSHVSHPNVTSATDFGHIEDGSCYLVLEYVEGITLHDLIKRGPIPAPRAAEIARQLGSALQAVHELDICHRDLKPRNVMVVPGEPDLVKLIDFGLAKVPLKRFSRTTSEEVTLTSTGVVFGTVAYMAPETARGMHAVTERSDLYALGIVFYEMLTGKHPFDETEPTALFLKHRTAKPPPFRERAPGVEIPAALEAVVMRLLEKEPEDRYQTALEFIDAVDEATGAEPRPAAGRTSKPQSKRRPSAASREPAPTERSPAPAAVAPRVEAPRRRSTLPWLLVGAVVIAGGVVFFRGIPELGLAGAGAEPTRPSPPPTGPVGTAAPSAVPTGAITAAASASASAAPTAAISATTAVTAAPASSLPRVDSVDGLDGPAWRGVLKEATDAKDWLRAANAFIALAKIEPDAFTPEGLAPVAAQIAINIELGDRPTADKVYDLLGSGALGGGGPDILYQMVSFFGGSRGAKRATEILKRPGVIDKASPALKVSLELREAPCNARGQLFERAASEGDDRTFAIFVAMRAADCDPMSGACCIRTDPKLEAAFEQLRVRLHR